MRSRNFAAKLGCGSGNMIRGFLQSALVARLGFDRLTPYPTAVLAAALLILVVFATPSGVGAAESGTAAAVSVGTAFDDFVTRHGGTDVIGPALGNPAPMGGEDGAYYRNHRNFKLEYWPEFAGTPYQVQPSLLGIKATERFWFPTIRPFESEESVVYFPETGHSVRFGFLDFFRANGGINLLGYPISEEIAQDGITVQYFQRGGLKYLPDDPVPVQPMPLGQEMATKAASPWRASVVTEALPEVAPPGATIRALVEITNTGSVAWAPTGDERFALSYHWKVDQPIDTNGDSLQFAIPNSVSPGGTTTLQVDIPVPDKQGLFSIIWDARIGEAWLSDVGIVGGSAHIQIGSQIPQVRVGILELGPANDEDLQATISATAAFTINTISGTEIASLNAEVRVVTTYSDGLYKLEISGREPILVTEPVLFTTLPEGLMIVDEIQPGSMYRGSFEFRHSTKLESSWLINILPMDDYLAGLIEQGEYAPWESLKASVITFRSYAVAVQSRIRKKNLEPFDLASSTTRTPSYFTRHQFYVGVRRDYQGGRLRAAIEETRGRVITFEGAAIEAVYFSQAGGRTYTWADTWGPPGRAWAIGVDDPISADWTQIGHGVGMPLRSANALASQGYAAEQILKKYYSGVELGYAY